MKILFIGADKAIEAQLLHKEANARGHYFDISNFMALSFVINKNQAGIFFQQKDIAETYDIVIIRGFSKHLSEGLVIADYMHQRGKKEVKITYEKRTIKS